MKSNHLKNGSAGGKLPCVWMQAGVVPIKSCSRDYHCLSCPFDRAMLRVADDNRRSREKGEAPKGKRGRIVFWKERMKALPSWKRPCLHHMKGRIEFRRCNHEYGCGNCEFDQYFHDQYAVHAVIRPVDVLNIKGFNLPQGYYFHGGHAWVKIEEGSSVRVGMDDFALRLLGPLDRIEAPLMGKEVKQNRADILLSRGANEASLLSPVSGVVTAINPGLREKGSLANRDPYSNGWIMRVDSGNLRRDLKTLMIGSEAGDSLGAEVDRLYRVIEEVAGPLATDGGHLVKDIYGSIPEIGWERLTRLFLGGNPRMR